MIRNEGAPRLWAFLKLVWLAALLLLALSGGARRALADDAIVTYQITNDPGNKKPAKGYAVFVNVTPDKIDEKKTFGKILNTIRIEPRPPLGTLIVFENATTGIPVGKTDDIQIRFKGLPKKKEVKFSDVSTLRSDVGRDAPVIQEEVPRVGMKTEKDPLYTILNADGQSPYTVTDLQYLMNVPEITDTTSLLDFGSSFGFIPLVPDTTSVDLVSSPELTIPGNFDPGNWYYVRGIAHIDGLDVPFVHGATEDIAPEPSSLALAGIGLLATGMGSRRRRSCKSSGGA